MNNTRGLRHVSGRFAGWVIACAVLLPGTVAVGGAQARPAGQACEELAGKIGLCLPKTLYAVPGVEMNVYFDNVVLAINPSNYAFDVTCGKGTQQAERWTFTPAGTDVGDHPFMLEVRDQAHAVIARARSTVCVVPADAGAGRPLGVLIIGDSLTAASVYPRHLLELCGPKGNPRVTLIGSHGPGGKPGTVRHEGYGGWTASRFATHFTGVARQGHRSKRGSPFIYGDGKGKPTLDFARYCSEFNGARGPDFVTILLGCNDVFSATDDDIEQRINAVLGHYDTLIRMIHGVRKDTAIGALLLVPPAASQDAFGVSYRCGQTRWQYKRNQHRVVQRMTAHYGGREAKHLYLVPTNVNLDCVHNYPQHAPAWNARTDQKGARLANGVHPAASGYRQIGDTIYCWMKARLAETSK